MTARAAAVPAGLAGGLRTPPLAPREPCAVHALCVHALHAASPPRCTHPAIPAQNPTSAPPSTARAGMPAHAVPAARAGGGAGGTNPAAVAAQYSPVTLSKRRWGTRHQSHRRCRAVLPSLPSNAGRPAPHFSPRCGSALPPCRLLYGRALAPPRPQLSTSGTGLPPPASRANAPRLRPRTAASAAAVAATVAGCPRPCAPPLTEHAARAAPGHTPAPAPAPMRRIVAGTAAPPGGARARDGAPCRTVAAPADLFSLPPRRSVPAAARGNRRLAGGPGFLPRPCRAQLFAARVLGLTAQPCPTGRRPA